MTAFASPVQPRLFLVRSSGRTPGKRNLPHRAEVLEVPGLCPWGLRHGVYGLGESQ